MQSPLEHGVQLQLRRCLEVHQPEGASVEWFGVVVGPQSTLVLNLSRYRSSSHGGWKLQCCPEQKLLQVASPGSLCQHHQVMIVP